MSLLADFVTETRYTNMNNLQEYLETNASNGIIDFRFRANPVHGAVHIYIHPLGADGETLDFYVSGNALIEKSLADKVSSNPGEAIEALRQAIRPDRECPCAYVENSNEPCADCPRVMSSLYRCGLLQEVAAECRSAKSVSP